MGVGQGCVDVHMEIVATARERLVLARDHGSADIRESMHRDGLKRIGRGVYLRMDPTWEAWQSARVVNAARTIAAVDSKEGARACLTSAVVLRGLPLWQRPEAVDVLLSRNCWRKPVELPAVVGKGSAEKLYRHGYVVGEDDREVVEGLPTVSLQRLALDVALQWHPRDALVTVDGILARLVNPDRDDRVGTEARAARERADLLTRLEALPRQRGLRKARAVIAAASPWSESPGESVTRWAALGLGLPEPVCQYRFTRSNGRFFYLDLYWELHRCGAEFDGHMKYKGDQGSEVVVAEKNRDDEIRRTGIALLHVDTPTANSVRALATALRSALPKEAWLQAPPRQGLWTPELGGWQQGR